MIISSAMTQVLIWLASLIVAFVLMWSMASFVVKVVVASRRMPKP